MAIVAGIAALDVPGTLAGGRSAVVAIEAARHDTRVIEAAGHRPRRRRMAILAGIAARQVPGAPAGGRSAVVAIEAARHDARVIEAAGRRRPVVCVVAGTAIAGRWDVSRVLARGKDAVVAARAGARDHRVIEGRRYPRDRAVALPTIVGAGHVVGRLARCDRAVVAMRAAVDDARVVESCRSPGRREVAVVARVRAGNVGAGLHLSLPAAPGEVADAALARSSFEQAAHMARFARRTLVSAGQGKPGAYMFEIVHVSGTDRMRQQHTQRDREQRATHQCSSRRSIASQKVAEWQRSQSRPNAPACRSSRA